MLSLPTLALPSPRVATRAGPGLGLWLRLGWDAAQRVAEVSRILWLWPFRNGRPWSFLSSANRAFRRFTESSEREASHFFEEKARGE